MGDFHLTSDEDIQYLITCEKRFTAPPKRPVYSDRDITQRFEVYSKEKDLKFNVLLRIQLDCLRISPLVSCITVFFCCGVMVIMALQESDIIIIPTIMHIRMHIF